MGFGGGKNQGGEIQNKINPHKSKVIHGHWHKDWDCAVSQKSSIREADWVPAGQGTKRVMGSESGKGEAQPRSSLVASAH